MTCTLRFGKQIDFQCHLAGSRWHLLMSSNGRTRLSLLYFFQHPSFLLLGNKGFHLCLSLSSRVEHLEAWKGRFFNLFARLFNIAMAGAMEGSIGTFSQDAQLQAQCPEGVPGILFCAVESAIHYIDHTLKYLLAIFSLSLSRTILLPPHEPSSATSKATANPTAQPPTMKTYTTSAPAS